MRLVAAAQGGEGLGISRRGELRVVIPMRPSGADRSRQGLFLRWSVPLFAVAVLVAACGGSAGTSGSGAGPSSSASLSGEPVDLVFISDSSGWQVAKMYAQHAQQALGRPVRVTDWAIGGLSLDQALAQVKADPSKLANAEIIVVGSIAPIPGRGTRSGTGADFEKCMEPTTQPNQQPPKILTVADWAPYQADLGSLYAEIWKLRQGAPAILRALDRYNPVISDWQAGGIQKECTAGFDASNGAIKAAALANGATFASAEDALNGPGHRQDPRAMGYISDDGFHCLAKGAALIADTLAAAGFEPNTMPTH